ncbi:MAG: hypothetical protein JOZ38_07145 [Candidatus Eremiobacteraeota bacterium]|nr:hypothetical protein [Candidatus Eremiobacteraeota bacterium]
MVIGIDFDNTIVNYDGLFSKVAAEVGLVPVTFRGSKTEIRDHLRAHGAGDDDWQRVQAEVYGRRIEAAPPFEGIREFLEQCRMRSIPTHIVSHKSTHAPLDPLRTDLRAAAAKWLQRHDVRVESVHFEGSRAAKLARIASLGCTHFVDDLEEIFLEPAFPDGVERWLFAPAHSSRGSGCRTVQSWRDLADELFGVRAR